MPVSSRAGSQLSFCSVRDEGRDRVRILFAAMILLHLWNSVYDMEVRIERETPVAGCVSNIALETAQLVHLFRSEFLTVCYQRDCVAQKMIEWRNSERQTIFVD